MTTDSSERVSGVVVRVAGSRWFVPVASVVEVLRAPAVARLPGAPPVVRGVVNHRGRVLTVADPVRCLGLPGDGAGAGDVLVVTAAGRRFAVAVDGVIELLAETRTGLAMLDLEAVSNAVFGGT